MTLKITFMSGISDKFPSREKLKCECGELTVSVSVERAKEMRSEQKVLTY